MAWEEGSKAALAMNHPLLAQLPALFYRSHLVWSWPVPWFAYGCCCKTESGSRWSGLVTLAACRVELDRAQPAMVDSCGHQLPSGMRGVAVAARPVI
jgi:hypothetical protein